MSGDHQVMPEPISTPPDEGEIEGRRERLRAAMGREQLDVLVLHDPANVFYLTNFANYVHERPFLLVFPARGTPRFVAPELECRHVEVRSVGTLEIVTYFEFPAPPGETWADRMRDAIGGAKRVGVETSCPLFVADAIESDPQRSEAVEETRMIKTDYEIGRIAYSASLINAAHAELMEKVQPGVMAAVLSGDTSRAITLRMLADIPNANMLATNVGAIVQPPSVSDDPHNFTNVLMAMEEGGPHVSVINAEVNGYGAELERTFFPEHGARGRAAPPSRR